ncbi:MAG TPA: GNAT family N-acetyltransferase, partial [Bacteroidia bacterium]|nr:GNAT family N-acetyltransferase [Bacteroidia bacterium]
KPEFQPAINEMMMRIQQEFAEKITSRHSTVIPEVYQLPDQKYWVAFHEKTVIGTIGIVLHAGHSAVVKRMMVDPGYRGNRFPTAKSLLETCFNWARQHSVQTIYLGTMTQFVAAQKFYVKNGFVEIRKEELPSDYNPNPMDTLFYKLTFQV